MPADVTETWSGRTWDLSNAGRNAARYFDVAGTTTPKDAENAVKTAMSVDINVAHPDNNQLLCSAIRLIEIKGPFFYRFGAIYGIPPNGQWVITNSDTPFTDPAQVEFNRALKSLPVDKDLTGNPYVNAASDPFSPNPDRSVTTRFMSVERYEPFWNLAIADVYENSVNSDVLTLGPLVFQPQQVLCHCIEPVGKFALTATKLLIRYEFEFDRSNPHPFQNRLINKGKNSWYTAATGGGTKLGQICYAKGDPITEDTLLDLNGKPVNSTLKVLDANGTPVSPVNNPNPPSYYATEHSSGELAYVLVFKERTIQPFLALSL